MKVSTKIRMVTLLMMVFVACVAISFAESGTDADKTNLTRAEGITSANMTKENFTAFLATMSEAAEMLKDSNPEVAQVLLDTVEEANRNVVAGKMVDVGELLEKRYTRKAKSVQDMVIEELDKLITRLRTGKIGISEQLERIGQLKAFRDDIERQLTTQKDLIDLTELIEQAEQLEKALNDVMKGLDGLSKDQQKLMNQTPDSAQDGEGIRKLGAIRDKVSEMIAKQEKISNATIEGAIDKRSVIGKKQDDLASDVAKLAKDLADIAKDKDVQAAIKKGGANEKAASDAAKAASLAAGEMAKAAGALSKSSATKAIPNQKQADLDLQKAKELLSEAIKKASADTKAGKLAEKQADLEKKANELADQIAALAAKAGAGKPSDGKPSDGKPSEGKPGENTQKARENMGKAKQDLSVQKPGDARKNQKKALENLAKAKLAIASLKRKVLAEAKKPISDKAKPQDKLSDETKKTADEMAKSDESGKKTPGQKAAAAAAAAMSKASSNMIKNKIGSVLDDQKDAVEQLEIAKEELEQEIAKQQAAAQQEALAKIDTLLAALLEEQKVITLGTVAVDHKRGDGEFSFKEKKDLKKLSTDEAKIVTKLNDIRKLLVDEGSSILFPQVLAEIGKDAQSVTNLLDKNEPGAYTQKLEENIEQSLAAMIESIRKELAERGKKKGGGGGGGPPPKPKKGGKKPPLLPATAELKMLLLLQMQIYRNTVTLNDIQADGKMTKDKVETEHKTLSKKQVSLKNMSDKMAKKIKKDQADAAKLKH